MQGLTNWPFSEVEKDAKDAFDEAGAQCLTYYVGDSFGKYGPLLQLSVCGSLIIADVYSKKQKQVNNKKENKTVINQIKKD